jgi:2-dehydro-3-deoxygluconokinase
MDSEQKVITTFGEIMLRLTPDDSGEKIINAVDFQIRPGGSEANVAIALSNLGEDAAFVSCLPRNQLGDKILRSLHSEKVQTQFILQNDTRIGIYWTETGLGPRNSNVIYDRENSGFSKLKYEDFQWHDILKKSNWFHFSGISPAVSEDVYFQLKRIVDQCNCPYSVDLNFREKLWKWVDKDPEKIAGVMKNLCNKAVLIAGNESDFQNIFGFQCDARDKIEYFSDIADQCFHIFPNLKYIAVSHRVSESATFNTWSGFLFVKETSIHAFRGMEYKIDCIADRVGTGDSFVAGIIYGLIHSDSMTFQEIIDFAVTLGALNHTTKGDASHFTVADVAKTIATSGSGRIIR